MDFTKTTRLTVGTVVETTHAAGGLQVQGTVIRAGSKRAIIAWTTGTTNARNQGLSVLADIRIVSVPGR